MLKVNEIFASIQGEGSRAGQAMTFVRLSGCNIFCKWCDTKAALTQGIQMSEESIVQKCLATNIQWVCITGGEPMMQDVRKLLTLLDVACLNVALETNGTLPVPVGFDHVTVSPKKGHGVDMTLEHCVDDWKYVICDEGDFERINREYDVFVQPVDNDMEIAQLCVQKILQNPGWMLSLQMHKLIGIR